MFNYDWVYQKSLEYFNGNELSAKVFTDKYALQDNNGNYYESTPDDMHKRLAKEFARIEQKYPNSLTEEQAYDYFKNFSRIIPQGSPMAGIGNPYQILSLGNCYVITAPHDSYGGIMYSDQELANLMKRRAGVGLDISSLRPIGMPVKNSAKTTTGIAGFMERFSNTCREVGQSGRRGALIEVISVHHPEVETFIDIKRDLKKVTGANISVQFTDEFMEAVKNDDYYEQRFPVDEKDYHLYKTDKPLVSKKVKAKEIWNKFVDSAWTSAEPGALFWSTANKYSPAHCYGKIDENFYNKACNPCGEIIMGRDSCRLLLVNLISFVKNKFTDQAYFDFNEFEQTAYDAQKMMDDIVDLELEKIKIIIDKIKSDPEPDNIKKNEIEMWEQYLDTCTKGRRTGLGITALGDVFASLGIRYGSEESIELTEKIYKTLCINAYKATIDMAEQRGSFPIFDLDTEFDNDFIKRIYDELPIEYQEKYKKYGRRNVCLLTTAPAGSVSLLALFGERDGKKYFSVTSGGEPTFLVEHIRRKKINPSDQDSRVDFIDELGDRWQEFNVYHTGHKYWKDVNNNINTEINNSPYFNSTSNDIDWVNSVNLQAVSQKWIDHSISKTCNLPKDVTKELVSEIYMRAWESGCKGFTIYRDGSRSGVLISNEEKQDTPTLVETNAPKRPTELPCEIHRVNIKGQSWVIFVGLLKDKPYELWGGLINDELEIPKSHKNGKIIKTAKGKYDLHYDDTVVTDLINTFQNPTYGFHTRAISTMLRHGVPLQYLVDQIQKDDKENTLYSFNKVIGRVLKKYIKEGTVATGQKCPSCGNTNLIYQEGCLSCTCGNFSKCS